MGTKRIHYLTRILVASLCLVGFLLNVLLPEVKASDPHRNNSSIEFLDVVINEVAWAGNVSDSQGEWIELYNPGSENITLDGWKLVADDGVPEIFLSGEIRKGEYYLMERNNESTISNIDADLTYGGEMDKENEVLRLYSPIGVEIDYTVLNGTHWPGGSEFPNYASMERKSVVDNSISAWGTNNGIFKNGLDFKNKPIYGTPGQLNSLAPHPTATLGPTPNTTLTTTWMLTTSPDLTITRTMSPTPTLPAPPHLVISQFSTHGKLGTEDEFIEIFNPSNAPVDISDWQIKKSSDCGQVVISLLTVKNGVILAPGQHFLAVSQYSSVKFSDQVYSLSVSDGGGLALENANETIVDQVGMCPDTQFHEGKPLSPLAGDFNQAYARKPAGENRGCVDSNRNEDDFYYLSPIDPKGLNSPIRTCQGVLTLAPTIYRTPIATPTAGVAMVTINEVLPHPVSDWNLDGQINVEDEFIEIMNIGSQAVNLRGWKLNDEDGGSKIFTLSESILLPGEIAVFYGSETGLILNDIGDRAKLIKPNLQMMDFFEYPTVTENGVSWCRLPDGTGPWNPDCLPTPDQENKRSIPAVTTPPPEQQPATEPLFSQFCPFAEQLTWKTDPAGCTGWGMNIRGWNFWKPGGLYLAPDRFKWAVWLH